MCRRAPACRPRLIYAWLRRFHGAGQRHDGGDREPARGTGRARLPQHLRAWSRGVDLDAVPAGAARGLGRPAAAGLPLCRPGGGGEEHRRLPRPRPARLEGRGRRRAAAAPRCSATIPNVHFTGPRYGEALARAYAGRRRVRVPEPDRHVRPGDPGGAGLRHAGRGLPGHRPEGRAGRRGAHGRRGATPICAPRRWRRWRRDRAACRAHAERFSWRACAETFLSHLVPLLPSPASIGRS